MSEIFIQNIVHVLKSGILYVCAALLLITSGICSEIESHDFSVRLKCFPQHDFSRLIEEGEDDLEKIRKGLYPLKPMWTVFKTSKGSMPAWSYKATRKRDLLLTDAFPKTHFDRENGTLSSFSPTLLDPRLAAAHAPFQVHWSL